MIPILIENMLNIHATNVSVNKNAEVVPLIVKQTFAMLKSSQCCVSTPCLFIMPVKLLKPLKLKRKEINSQKLVNP